MSDINLYTLDPFDTLQSNIARKKSGCMLIVAT